MLLIVGKSAYENDIKNWQKGSWAIGDAYMYMS